MVSLNQINQQDMYSSQKSILHAIDSRIKLAVVILIILFAVTSDNFTVFLTLEIYLLLLIVISKISLKAALIRVLLILPFGFFIAVFQPFIQPGEILYTLPLGIHITLEGILFAEILLARLIISITSIVLFSYITPMKDIAEAFRKLHFPSEFAMIFSLFVRFIFLFYDELLNILRAHASRGFSLKNKTSCLWKLKQIGYLFLIIFIKAYDKGEIIYKSMAGRCYNSNSTIYTSDDNLSKNSILYLLISVSIIGILIILEYIHII